MLGCLSKTIGLLSSYVFTAVFLVRVLYTRFHWPAVFGLSSLFALAAFASCIEYSSYRFAYVQWLLFLSLALAGAGIVLDARRFWLLLADVLRFRASPDTMFHPLSGHKTNF